jgi:hypothetical protein
MKNTTLRDGVTDAVEQSLDWSRRLREVEPTFEAITELINEEAASELRSYLDQIIDIKRQLCLMSQTVTALSDALRRSWRLKLDPLNMDPGTYEHWVMEQHIRKGQQMRNKKEKE